MLLTLDLGWLTPEHSRLWNRQSLSLDYEFYFVGDTKVELGININNLFDRTYYTAAAFRREPGNRQPIGGFGSFVGLAPGLRTYGRLSRCSAI